MGRARPRGLHRRCARPTSTTRTRCAASRSRAPPRSADHAARLWAAFPDARIERTGERLTDGRFVAAPCKLLGTHRGELEGLAPTGRFVVVHLVSYCELDPDRERLWHVRAFFDAYDAAVQLGVLPARGTLGERALFMLRGFGLRARGLALYWSPSASRSSPGGSCTRT